MREPTTLLATAEAVVLPALCAARSKDLITSPSPFHAPHPAPRLDSCTVRALVDFTRLRQGEKGDAWRASVCWATVLHRPNALCIHLLPAAASLTTALSTPTGFPMSLLACKTVGVLQLWLLSCRSAPASLAFASVCQSALGRGFAS